MATQDAKINIKDSLNAFASGNLTQNALNLFRILGYNTERSDHLHTPQYRDFKSDFVSGSTVSFDEVKALTSEWKYVDLLFQLSQAEMTKQVSMFDTKKVDNTIIEAYTFFVIELQANEYSRTKLTQITREINRLFPMPVLVLFKYGQLLTLSVINRRLHKKEESKDVLLKVTLIKDIDIDNLHRAHIEILFDLSFDALKNKFNPSNFVELHKAWQKTLDTKELNAQFYKKLSAWYHYAALKVRLPNLSTLSDEENRKQFLVRLIARMIFCWFLKEKNLIPKHLLEIEDFFKNPKPLTDDVKDSNALSSNSYYLSILQNIFFKSLNEPLAERQLKAFFHPKLWHTDFDGHVDERRNGD